MARHSADRINRILKIIDGTKYLEIGVASGNTFLRVDALSKVAVDPKFRFNTEAEGNDSVKFFECTSDDFFNQHQDSVFDVIFLDGLHTFEQTLKDLLSALSIISPNGVIIIDDVFPEDFAGSLKSMKAMREYRIASEDTGPRHWWGDVYKLIPFIHDFLPSLEYRTTSQGKKQTIVYKTKTALRRNACFSDMNQLLNMGYSELQTYLDLWKFCDEREIDAFIAKSN